MTKTEIGSGLFPVRDIPDGFNPKHNDSERGGEAFDFAKTVGAIETHRALIAHADGEMGAPCAHRCDRVAPAIDQKPPDPLPLQPRQKIDVQVRGIRFHDPWAACAADDG